MKNRIIPVKRRNRSHGMFHRLSAAVARRRQRVAAGAPSVDIDDDESDARIGRALLIIFAIHLLAGALVFTHHKYLKHRSPVTPVATAPAESRSSAPAEEVRITYIVKEGDSYASIAAAHRVDEAALRVTNRHATLRKGLIVGIPKSSSAIASRPDPALAPTEPEDAPAAAVVRTAAKPATEEGLVPAVDVKDAPKARAVATASAKSPTTAQGARYVVKPGDSIWRIANTHKVDQQELMKANGLDDARKLRSGMTLVIPKAP